MASRHRRSPLVTSGLANQRVYLKGGHLALFVRATTTSHKEVFIHFHLEQPVVARETSYWSTYLVISFCACHQYCANIHPCEGLTSAPASIFLLPSEFGDILFWKVKSMNEYEVLVCNIVQAQGSRSFIDLLCEHWRGTDLSAAEFLLYMYLPCLIFGCIFRLSCSQIISVSQACSECLCVCFCPLKYESLINCNRLNRTRGICIVKCSFCDVINLFTAYRGGIHVEILCFWKLAFRLRTVLVLRRKPSIEKSYLCKNITVRAAKLD